MMPPRHAGAPCPTSVAVGRGLAELAGGVAALTFATLASGLSTGRNIVEGLAWRGSYPAGGCGYGCGCCMVRHHYCCRCIPSPGGGCCY